MSVSLPRTYTRITLQSRPEAPILPDTFKTEKLPAADLRRNLKDGQALIKVDYVSLDPAMRGWLRDQR